MSKFKSRVAMAFINPYIQTYYVENGNRKTTFYNEHMTLASSPNTNNNFKTKVTSDINDLRKLTMPQIIQLRNALKILNSHRRLITVNETIGKLTEHYGGLANKIKMIRSQQSTAQVQQLASMLRGSYKPKFLKLFSKSAKVGVA